MARIRSHLPTILTTLFFVTVFLVFFNGYKQRGPSRRKFQKLPGGTEDVAADEIKPEGEDKLVLELAANKRIKKWVRDWQRCMPEFDIRAMDDVGEAEIDYEPVDMALVKKSCNSARKMSILQISNQLALMLSACTLMITTTPAFTPGNG